MKDEMETISANTPRIENAVAAIVLTAQTFNPSIFTESWLTQNDLIPAEAFVGLRIFSPELAQFQTSGVQVVVVPPTMQIAFGIHGTGADFELPQRFARRTVELLPHTPYQALGINFNYFVAPPTGEDFCRFNRALLGTGSNGLLQEFSDPDAKFGRYFSKNHGDGRLKLDVKPVLAGPEKNDLIQFAFNFHYDVAHLTADRALKISTIIGGWTSLREYAERLVGVGIPNEFEAAL